MRDEKSKRLGQLLVQAQEGNNSAYNEFLEELTKELRPFLQKRIQNPEHTEDVLQDVLIAIHMARHSYRPEASLAPWIYAIATHRMLDYFRRFRRQEKRETSMSLDFDIAANGDAKIEHWNLTEVELALHQLPSKQKKIITMLKLEGYSVNEVAMKFKITEGLVKVTASRGYHAIRLALGLTKNKGQK